jgi:molecular chaperone IbpA
MKEYHVTTLDISSLPRFAIGFERMFEELARTQEKLTNSNYPPYNVVRLSETQYAFEIAVAGFEENELTVEIVDGELVVRGEADKTDQHTGNYLHQGIARRNFTRTFALSDNTTVNGATVRNGILTIVVEVFIPQSKVEKVAITFEK